jgi:hypothetical protein
MRRILFWLTAVALVAAWFNRELSTHLLWASIYAAPVSAIAMLFRPRWRWLVGYNLFWFLAIGYILVGHHNHTV